MPLLNELLANLKTAIANANRLVLHDYYCDLEEGEEAEVGQAVADAADLLAKAIKKEIESGKTVVLQASGKRTLVNTPGTIEIYDTYSYSHKRNAKKCSKKIDLASVESIQVNPYQA